MDGEAGKISSEEESSDDCVEDKGRNRKEEDDYSDEDDEDCSDVVFSKDFEDDFNELTKDGRVRKNIEVSPYSKDRDQADCRLKKGHVGSLPMKTSSPKIMSREVQNSGLPTKGSDQSKGEEEDLMALNAADTSITTSMGNVSFVENVRSGSKKHRIEPSLGVNLTAKTFNLSGSGKPLTQVLDVSSIRDDSFSSPLADNLSFVSISSPGKRACFKSKRMESKQQKVVGDTYTIDDILRESVQAPSKTEFRSQIKYTRIQPFSRKSQANLCIEKYPGLHTETERSSQAADDLINKSPSVRIEQNKPVTADSDAVFKSPQGIRVRRIRPKLLSSNVSDATRETCTSGAQNVHTSPSKSPSKFRSIAESWGKCDSIISSMSSPSTENLPQSPGHNRDEANPIKFDSTQDKEEVYQEMRMDKSACKGIKNTIQEGGVSFSTSEESDRPWSKACELAMKSPAKRKDHSHGHSENQTGRIASRETDHGLHDWGKSSPSKSSRLNVSLTSSFKTMDLQTEHPANRHAIRSTGSLKQSRAVSTRSCGSSPQNAQVTVENRGRCGDLKKSNTTFTKLCPRLPSLTRRTQQMLFPETPAAGGERNHEGRLKAAGFDPHKWRCRETVQPKGQSIERMKRKIPASFTSGYNSLLSPSLQEVRPPFESLTPNNVEITQANEEQTSYRFPNKQSQQNGSRSHCPYPQSNLRQCLGHASESVFGSDVGNRLDFRDLHGIHSSVKENSTPSRALQGDKTLVRDSYNDKHSKPNSNQQFQSNADNMSRMNPFLQKSQQDRTLCQFVTPQPLRPQVFFNMDNSHVLRWLEASSKHYKPPQTIRHPSCPPRLPVSSRHNCAASIPRNRFQENESENPLKLSTSHRSSDVRGPETKDVGVQTSMDNGSFPGLPSPSTSVSPCPRPDSHHCLCCSSKPMSSCPSIPKLSEFSARPSFPSPSMTSQLRGHSVNIKAGQSYLGRPSSQGMRVKLFSGDHDSLNKRAIDVWREIQANKSENDSCPDDFSIIDTETSESPSPSLNDEQSCGEDYEEEEFTDNDEVVHETLVEPPELRRQGCLLDDLNKMFGGKLESKSFVESQMEKSKSRAGVKKQSSSLADPQQTPQNIMFPMSYINQFSPDNPARRDSDIATYLYEQQVVASASTFKSMLTSFKPWRNQHRVSAPMASQTKYVPTCPPMPAEDVLTESPCKFRKVTKSSPPRRKFKSLGYKGQTMPATHIKAQQAMSFKSQTPMLAAACIPSANNSQSPSAVARASTPVKKTIHIPDLALDETVSTIISPMAAAERDKIHSPGANSTLTPQDSVDSVDFADSDDSSDEVSLL